METHSSSQRFGLSPRSDRAVSPLARRSESETSGNPFIHPHRMAFAMRDARAVNDCYDIDARTAKAAEAFIGLIIRNTAVLLGKGLIVILAVVSTYLVVSQ